MNRGLKLLALAYGTLTLGVLIWGVVRAFGGDAAPTAGQTLILLHLPAACNALLGALVVCVASVAYLGRRRPRWDHLGHAAAEVTVLNASVLLISGMCWAKVVWGTWWLWSPRLSFSLILWGLYVLYLVMRSGIRSPERRAMLAAGYGAIAFLDVPLLYLAVNLLPDIHPTTGAATKSAGGLLAVWMTGVTLLSVGLIITEWRALRRLERGDPSDEPRMESAARVG